MASEENPFFVDPKLQAILMSADEESWIRVRLNGISLYLPAGTILTMAHCLVVGNDNEILLDVETAHLDWMRDRLSPGAIFLDVGAATGAMTLPIAMQFPGVRIIAIEPAARATRLLTASLIRNETFGVNVLRAAISDSDETVFFDDRPSSSDGSIPFLPETSTILRPEIHQNIYGTKVEMRSMRLDTLAESYGISKNKIVLKIDIEGFEALALNGAADFLADNEVSLAIDIHNLPGDTSGRTTEEQCRAILDGYGYKDQEMLGHVLLAERA